jgi:hypothetical protein
VSRYQAIEINNIKEIEFREDFYEPEDENTIIKDFELLSISYDTEDRIYIIKIDDGFIFNPREIKVTYKDEII